MSTFDHAGLIQNINEALGPFRKSQPEAMQGFGQLARAAMAEGAVSQAQRAHRVGHWHHPALLGLCGFSCQSLAQTGLYPRRAGRNAVGVRLHGRWPSVDVQRGNAQSLGRLGLTP